jgi:hypothetical protein
MRVWDCAPHELNDKHLRAEHKEIGALLNGKWASHPEAKRFNSEELEHLLIIRHSSFIMPEAIKRGFNFNTDWIETYKLSTFGFWLIKSQRSWYQFRKDYPWPKSYKKQWWSPWKRDQMTREEYKLLGNNWSRAYKYGKRPDPDPFNISVRRNPYA